MINIDELVIGVLDAAPIFLMNTDIPEIVGSVKVAGGFDINITDIFAQVSPGQR